jgi:hypothetical protein
MSIVHIIEEVIKKYAIRAGWLLLLILLLGRIVFIDIINIWFRFLPVQVRVVYELVMYLLIFLFMWKNMDILSRFHLDRFSIILIILFSTILRCSRSLFIRYFPL